MTIAKPGHYSRGVRVIASRIDAPCVCHRLEGMLLKKEGIWHHPARNRRIKHLANAVCSGDSRLATEFPSVAAGLAARMPRGVLVLVEGLEHGRALAKLMPRAHLFHRAGRSLDKAANLAGG